MNKKESDIVNLPVEDATYTAQYEIRTYTIKFYGIDDTLLSIQNLNSGETVEIPMVPNVGTLSFVEWNKPVSTTAVADDEYFACPEQSEITFTYNGETYTHGVFSYETMNDLYNKLRDSHKSLRYKDEPYYKSYRYETIKSIKYSSKVKHAVMSEFGSYYDIDYDSLDELDIEINSNLISDKKYINELTVKDTVKKVNLKNCGTTYNKIVDLHNVNTVSIDWLYVDRYFGFKKLIIPADSFGSRYNADIVIFYHGTGLPSDIDMNIAYGNHRIVIGDGIYDVKSDIPNYKLNENIVYTNTDDSYYTLIADNTDWIDDKNVNIYDSKRTRKLGRYNLETFVFTIEQEFTLTFNSNGGTYVDAITQEYGTEVTAPANPTREYFTFIGWDKEIPATMPNSDMTFTAQWKANQYKVVFVLDNDVISEAIIDYGSAITVPKPVREGYTCCWDKDIPTTMPAYDITVNGHWQIEQYTFTFVLDNEVIGEVTLDYGSPVTTPEFPTREGYTIYWRNGIPTTMPAYNYTAEGVWQANVHTFKFYSNGGTYVAAIIQEYGTEVTAPEVPPCEGYTFIGWDPQVPATMPDSDMTFTAVWKANQYKVVFVSDNEVISEETIDYGSAITVPEVPTRGGYTFIGWDPAVPSTMPASDMTFTAQYESIEGQQIECVITTWDEKNVGINTGIYPTIDTKMIIVANLYGEGDINIGIAKDGTVPWHNDNGDNPDDMDWRLFYTLGSAKGIYWDFGSFRMNCLYMYYKDIDSKCTYICSSKGLKIFRGDDISDPNLVYDKRVNPTSLNVLNYPIWIAPRTYREHYGTYYDIKIYEGDELLRHYIPWRDKYGVVCFKEEISNTLCYPQVGTWTTTSSN